MIPPRRTTSSPFRVLFAVAFAAALAAGVSPASGDTKSPSATDRVSFLVDSSADLSAIAANLKAAGWRLSRDRSGERVKSAAPQSSVSASVADVVTMLRGEKGVIASDPDQRLSLKSPWSGGQSEASVFMSDLPGAQAQMSLQPALDVIHGRPAAPPTADATTSSTPPPPPAPILVAVIDGGFAADHEALAGAIGQGYDAIDGDSTWADAGNGIDDDGDGVVDGGLGHGTAIASLVRLVCPTAVILPVRALDDEGYGSEAAFAAGLDWAVRMGARVVNVSAGRTSSSSLFDASLANAKAAGVVVICSAGNGGLGDVWYPARSGKALAITGCTLDAAPDPLATAGSSVDLAAPSVAVIAAHPRSRTAYGYWYGTSFSAAFVTGGAAMAAASRGLTGDQLQTLLVDRLTQWAIDSTNTSVYGDGILSVADLLR